MTITYETVAERTGTEIPAHLIAQAEPPTTDRLARQGDVMVIAYTAPEADERDWRTMQIDLDHFAAGGSFKEGSIRLAGAGHNVVEGDVGRNRHILSTQIGGKSWFREGAVTDPGRDYGFLWVAPGETVELTHTGEHGTISILPGAYRVLGQTDLQTMKRVAD